LTQLKVPPTTSLIVATYNWPGALFCCLKSVARQKVLPKEVVIADDGSGPETKILIEQMRVGFPVPIIHIWQEDLGFRKSEILNKAVRACSGEYLIQVDGDVILHRHFISDHQQAAEPQMFIRGSRARLTPFTTDKVLNEPEKHLHFLSRGLLNKLNAIHLPQLSFLAHRKKMCSRSVRGSNLAFWKNDFVLANGYNNDLQGWGHEDEELAARFINNRIIKKIVKLSAIQYHLHHHELQKDKEKFHTDVLKEVILNKIKTCPNGFGQLPHEPPTQSISDRSHLQLA
jgi:glycosyltransferase involved in cell wall biosynthesis